MNPQSPPIDIEEERRRVEVARKMPLWRKVQFACELGELEKAVLNVRIRLEMPDASPAECEREFLCRCWGSELADQFLKARADAKFKAPL